MMPVRQGIVPSLVLPQGDHSILGGAITYKEKHCPHYPARG